MSAQEQVFHTKHDFSPGLGWSAFQLLAEVGKSLITPNQLQEVASVVSSPLTKRADLNKLLASMQDVGLIERNQGKISLSEPGKLLANGLGCYEPGFRAGVHCLYFWRWLWNGIINTASPSWSYREVCRQILAKGSSGISRDEIVLRVVSEAECFETTRVAFSRSSVSGVTMWLEAQIPPLITRKGDRVFCSFRVPTADSITMNLASLCKFNGGQAVLDERGLQLLAECLLMPPNYLLDFILEFLEQSNEFVLMTGTPYRILFRDSNDPFINWIAEGTQTKVNAYT